MISVIAIGFSVSSLFFVLQCVLCFCFGLGFIRLQSAWPILGNVGASLVKLLDMGNCNVLEVRRAYCFQKNILLEDTLADLVTFILDARLRRTLV